MLQTHAPRSEAFQSLRFAILISGFPSRGDDHAHFYNSPIDLPSLHVWGQKDEVVLPASSKALLQKFHGDTRCELVHAGGHVVPSNAECRAGIVEFLLPFRGEGCDTARAAL